MGGSEEVQWSPARDPYAIAVSQAWWAARAVQQFAADIKATDDPVRQIYARQIFGQLRQMHICAAMLARELVRLGVDEVHQDQLQREIDAFHETVPGAKDARDLLEHFDEYARGEGRLQRRAMREFGMGFYEAAAMFWGGGYDPTTEAITEGPFTVIVPRAIAASQRLQMAIYVAALVVDARRVPE